MKANVQAKRTRTRKVRRKPQKTLFLLLSFVFLLLFSGIVFRYTEIARLGRQVAELDTRKEDLTARRDALQLQISPHTRKSYIEDVAKKELNMIYTNYRVAEAGEIQKPVIETAAARSAPTLFGQLSVFVFSLLYR